MSVYDLTDPLLSGHALAPPEGDGTGFYRGEGEPVGPAGQNPDPNAGAASERQMPLYSPVAVDPELAARVAEELAKMLRNAEPLSPDGQFSFALDGSGNGVCVVYNVAAGMEFCPSRIVFADADGTYTPASPYSNAAAWVGVYRLDAGAVGGAGPSTEAFTPGGLRDFGPSTAGGPILPGLLSDGFDTTANYKGPCSVGLRIVGGPASKTIVGYFCGELRRLRGSLA